MMTALALHLTVRRIVLEVLEDAARRGNPAAWDELRERHPERATALAVDLVMADLDALDAA